MKRLTASPDVARDAAGRITAGSRILTDRITRGAGEWVRKGRRDDLTGISAVLGCWLRVGMLLGAAYGLYSAMRAMPWLMWAATTLWCWKAWRAKPAAPAAEDAVEPAENDGQEQPEQTPVVDLRKPGPPTPEQLVHALHEVASPHAHLASLARHIGTTPGRVREGLEGAGIPVSGGVREGARVSTGVRAEDIPPLPHSDRTVPGPHKTAGQRDNNNSNNVTIEHPHPGMTIVRYPQETAQRTHRVQRP